MTVYNSTDPETEPSATRSSKVKKIAQIVIINAAAVTFFIFALIEYINWSMT